MRRYFEFQRTRLKDRVTLGERFGLLERVSNLCSVCEILRQMAKRGNQPQKAALHDCKVSAYHAQFERIDLKSIRRPFNFW